ncbi:MAG: single-stranded DNA-binding protein [Bdellovibrionales bacterium]
MGRSMNKVMLIGHIGHEPELHTSKSGRNYVRLNLATHKVFMDQTVGRREITEWHSIFVWGTLAERCATFLAKGSLIYVEGSLNYWREPSDNKAPFRTAIFGYEVKFLGPPKPVTAVETQSEPENLDNPDEPGNHDAVAHL